MSEKLLIISDGAVKFGPRPEGQIAIESRQEGDRQIFRVTMPMPWFRVDAKMVRAVTIAQGEAASTDGEEEAR